MAGTMLVAEPNGYFTDMAVPALAWSPWFLRYSMNKDIDTKGEKVISFKNTVGGESTECSRMQIDKKELAQNVTYCLGDGGHLPWGILGRYAYDKMRDEIQDENIKAQIALMWPDNPSYDHPAQVIQFVQDRGVLDGDNGLKLTATALAALGIAAFI